MARRSMRSGCIVTRIIDLTPPDRFFRTHMRRCRSRVENQGLVALLDRHDRPFVPTCPNTEHRAQRKARLARQDHRRQAAWACRSEHNAILPEVESCDHDRPCRKQTSHSARRKRRRDNSYPVGRRGGQTQLPCASARGLGGGPEERDPSFAAACCSPVRKRSRAPLGSAARLGGGQRPSVVSAG